VRFVNRSVATILSERDGLQRVELDDGSRALVLTALIGPVAAGDRVVVNTTAVDHGLGTGGWHVVHWNLDRREWSEPGPGHVIKGRYTSLQADVGSSEESWPELADSAFKNTVGTTLNTGVYAAGSGIEADVQDLAKDE